MMEALVCMLETPESKPERELPAKIVAFLKKYGIEDSHLKNLTYEQWMNCSVCYVVFSLETSDPEHARIMEEALQASIQTKGALAAILECGYQIRSMMKQIFSDYDQGIMTAIDSN